MFLNLSLFVKQKLHLVVINLASCEMCGREIYGRPISIKIEGAELSVCPACSKHGQKVVKSKPKPSASRMRAPVRSAAPPTKTYTSRPSRDRMEEKQLVPDYSERIRRIQRTNI